MYSLTRISASWGHRSDSCISYQYTMVWRRTSSHILWIEWKTKLDSVNSSWL